MSPPVIAVVDDDQTFRALVQARLEEAGYRTVGWPGGAGVFGMLKREPPALLILDLHLEREGTGLSLLQALRLDPTMRALPVIVCTGDVPWLKDNALRLRMKGMQVLAKPCGLDALLALVRSVIGEAGRAPDEAQARWLSFRFVRRSPSMSQA